MEYQYPKLRKYIEDALGHIKRNTCEVCGNLGAYPTPTDPCHRICSHCRETLRQKTTQDSALSQH